MVALGSLVVAEKVRSSQVLDVFKNHSQQKLLTYLEKLPALKFKFFIFSISITATLRMWV